MSKQPRSAAGEPVDLGNMRENGVRSLAVSCWICHHRAILSADRWPHDVPVPSFGQRMVCTGCGIIGAIGWSIPLVAITKKPRERAGSKSGRKRP